MDVRWPVWWDGSAALTCVLCIGFQLRLERFYVFSLLSTPWVRVKLRPPPIRYAKKAARKKPMYPDFFKKRKNLIV
jgi:hypothetical protein